MSGILRILNRGIVHSLTGLSVQLSLSGLAAWLTNINTYDINRQLLWISFAGVLIWLHLLVTYLLLRYEARNNIRSHANDTDAAEPICTDGGKNPGRLIHRGYQRFMLPLIELGVAALLIKGTLSGVAFNPSESNVIAENILLLIALYSVATLFLIVFAVYLTALMKANSWELLKSGRNYTSLMALIFSGLLAASCGEHLGIIRSTWIISWGFSAIGTMLAAEVLLSILLRFFAARRPYSLPRPAFDFYILESLSQPLRTGETFAAMLENFFGFDITQTSFGKVARSLIMPAIVLTCFLLLSLSSLVIIKPYEQAILLNLGRLKDQPLRPGLHLKLPWPLASVRHYNVAQVRSIHVGSHKPDRTGGTVYREGVPILWTNLHGTSTEELLICSSPQDKEKTDIKNGQDKGGKFKVPSVSLAGADVHIQFVVSDLVSFVRSSATPEVFLQKVSETCASRFIYQYDIDSLFCEARLSLVEKIRRSIQDTCDNSNLGVRIVHVSITAVHPPVEVAGAFEETVAGMQERETKIQQATQQAVKNQIEATGSLEAFARLSALADAVDSGHKIEVANHERLLHQCGGEVSQILTEAESYRFSRENVERGKTERFGEQLRSYTASPRNYHYDQYFSILEKGLSESRKVVLLGDTDNTIVRMGLGKVTGMNLIPGEIEF